MKKSESGKKLKGEFPASDSEPLSGFWSGPGFVNEKVEYVIMNGMALAEGDICLGTAEELKKSNDNTVLLQKAAEEKMRSDDAVTSMPLAAGAIVGAQYRWPSCTMAYVFDASLSDQAKVTDAMNHWTDKTSFKFKARTTESDYVRFFDDGTGSLWSYVGRRGGKQDLCLGTGFSFGNAVHEMGHAIGYFHEQSRNDRNNFVTINWQNIVASAQHNFAQYLNSGQDIGAYDYCSIMHYPRKAFSINGQDTITPLKAGAECMGQRTALSAGDIAAMKTMYPDCVLPDPCRKYWVAAQNCLRLRNYLCYYRYIVAYFLCKYRFTRQVKYLNLYKIYRARYGPVGPIPKGLVVPEQEFEAVEAEAVEPEFAEELEVPFEEEVELEPMLEEEAELPLEEEAEVELEPALDIRSCDVYRKRAAYYLSLYRTRRVKVYLCYYYRFLAAYYCCLFSYTRNKYHYSLCQLYTRRYRECMLRPV